MSLLHEVLEEVLSLASSEELLSLQVLVSEGTTVVVSEFVD